jgi:hypothetical protein
MEPNLVERSRHRRSLHTLAGALAAAGLGLSLTPTAASPKTGDAVLELVGSFETLGSLGFTPDDVVYWPERNHLLISSASPPWNGLFEVTLDGQLVQDRSFADVPDLTGAIGFSLARVTTGPRRGHFFLAEQTATPSVRVHEFDAEFNHVGYFPFTGTGGPGDGITYNQLARTLVIGEDGGATDYLSEVTLDGVLLRRLAVPRTPSGLTFCPATGTYFLVDCGGPTLFEFTVGGVLVREFDMSTHGVGQPVGVACGGGRLFVADEIDPANTGGVVWIFRVPTR